MHAFRLLPGEQDLGGRSGRHRQRRTDRHRVAQPGGPLRGGDADPGVGLPAVELRALPGLVPERDEDRLGDGQQAILARGGGQFGDPRPQDEPPGRVAREQPVPLECHGQPVGGRPGQTGGLNQLGEGGRP